MTNGLRNRRKTSFLVYKDVSTPFYRSERSSFLFHYSLHIVEGFSPLAPSELLQMPLPPESVETPPAQWPALLDTARYVPLMLVGCLRSF